MSWYKPHWSDYIGLPLSWGFQVIAWVRRAYLTHCRQQKCSVPIIVVGNITVGGVGKTPLVIALADYFQTKGVRVGIVSRGYGAKIKIFPHAIQTKDTAQQVGDEPFLIFQKTNCPVVIAPKRMQAVEYLLQHFSCQVIISDDGLQHYTMGRAVEIAVVDGMRGLGNGLCLPMGPLRESARRLKQVDFLVVNGNKKSDNGAYQMHLVPGSLYRLIDNTPVDYNKVTYAAVAGIGHPQRFFNTLTELGILHRPYIFQDHYSFSAKDLSFPEKNIVMTEKDAVKCLDFATESMYVLPIEAKLDSMFWQSLATHEQLKGLFK